MPKLKREYSIALMVIAGALLLVFGVNYLKGLDLLQRRNVYHAVYTDISGIAETSPLLLNGYKVGSVVATDLLPGSNALIVVSFQLNEDGLKLPRDTHIRIKGDLLNKWTELMMGDSAVLAEPGDTLIGDVTPGLTEALGQQIDPLKRKAETMLVSVDSVLTAFQQVLNPKARNDIDSSLSSIRSTLESLDKAAQQLNQLIAVERRTISATLGNLESVSGNLRNNNVQITRILQNLDTTAATLANGSIQRTLSSLDSTMAEARTIMGGLREGNGTLGQLMANDSLYRNLERASNELDLLLEDVRLNPNRYVHVSVFGKKDKLPKLSDSDVQRIGDAVRNGTRE